MAEVTLEGITKVFRDGTVAIDDLELRVPDGSFFVVLGPSGCGKTTLLRLVAGLEEPTDGRIWIGGVDVTDDGPRDRDVAMVFQSYALYPHLTAYDNIAFGLRSRRKDKREVDRRVRAVASILGLDDVLRKRPRSLSGGQRQRVALGRAIVREPQAFLMDEPLSDVDAKLRDQMRGELSRIQRSLGATTIYVTHDQAEALQLADLVAVLDRGVLRQVGTPRALYDRPDDLFVAAFLGTPGMNLVEATVERGDGRPSVRFGAHRLPLADVDGIADGRPVIAGIRPEHLRPRRSGDDASGTMTITVDRHDRLGGDGLLRFAVEAPPPTAGDPGDAVEPDPWAAARTNTFTARVDGEGDDDWTGRTVDLAVDPSRVLLFDPETELAIR